VPRFAVGADHHLGLKIRAELSTPELESTAGDELEIIEVSVNAEDFHDFALVSTIPPASASE
jgi:hypothetical protein